MVSADGLAVQHISCSRTRPQARKPLGGMLLRRVHFRFLSRRGEDMGEGFAGSCDPHGRDDASTLGRLFVFGHGRADACHCRRRVSDFAGDGHGVSVCWQQVSPLHSARPLHTEAGTPSGCVPAPARIGMPIHTRSWTKHIAFRPCWTDFAAKGGSERVARKSSRFRVRSPAVRRMALSLRRLKIWRWGWTSSACSWRMRVRTKRLTSTPMDFSRVWRWRIHFSWVTMRRMVELDRADFPCRPGVLRNWSHVVAFPLSVQRGVHWGTCRISRMPTRECRVLAKSMRVRRTIRHMPFRLPRPRDC